MSAMQTGTTGRAPGSTTWGSTIRFAAAVSALAAVAALLLGGHMAERTLIVGVIAASSLLGWFHAGYEPITARVAPRRR